MNKQTRLFRLCTYCLQFAVYCIVVVSEESIDLVPSWLHGKLLGFQYLNNFVSKCRCNVRTFLIVCPKAVYEARFN